MLTLEYSDLVLNPGTLIYLLQSVQAAVKNTIDWMG